MSRSNSNANPSNNSTPARSPRQYDDIQSIPSHNTRGAGRRRRNQMLSEDEFVTPNSVASTGKHMFVDLSTETPYFTPPALPQTPYIRRSSRIASSALSRSPLPTSSSRMKRQSRRFLSEEDDSDYEEYQNEELVRKHEIDEGVPSELGVKRRNRTTSSEVLKPERVKVQPLPAPIVTSSDSSSASSMITTLQVNNSKENEGSSSQKTLLPTAIPQTELWTKAASRLAPISLRSAFASIYTPVRADSSCVNVSEGKKKLNGHLYIPRFSNETAVSHSKILADSLPKLTDGGILKLRATNLGLQNILSDPHLSAQRNSYIFDPPLRLQVLSVHRYIGTDSVIDSVLSASCDDSKENFINEYHQRQKSGTQGVFVAPGSMYDAILSDGQVKTKVVLDRSLAKRVEAGLIRTGTIVQVTHAVRRDILRTPKMSPRFNDRGNIGQSSFTEEIQISELSKSSRPTGGFNEENDDDEVDADFDIGTRVEGGEHSRIDLPTPSNQESQGRLEVVDNYDWSTVIVIKELFSEVLDAPIIVSAEVCQKSHNVLSKILGSNIYSLQHQQAFSSDSESNSIIPTKVFYLDSILNRMWAKPVVFPCITPGEVSILGLDQMLGAACLIPFSSKPGAPEQKTCPLVSASNVYIGLYSNDGLQPVFDFIPVLSTALIQQFEDDAFIPNAINLPNITHTSPYKMLESLCDTLKLDFASIEGGISTCDFLALDTDETHVDVSHIDADLHEEAEFQGIGNLNKASSTSYGEGFHTAAACLKPLVQSVFQFLFACVRSDLVEFRRYDGCLSESVLGRMLTKATIDKMSLDEGKSVFLQGVPALIFRSGSLLHGGIGTEGAWSSLLYSLSYLSSLAAPLRSIISQLSEKLDDATEFLVALVSLHAALAFIKEFRWNFAKTLAQRVQMQQNSGGKGGATLFHTKFLKTTRDVFEEFWMCWSSLIDVEESSTPPQQDSSSNAIAVSHLSQIDASVVFPNRSLRGNILQWIDELGYIPSTPLATVVDIRRAASRIPSAKSGNVETVARASAKGDLIGRVVAKSRVVNFGDPKKSHKVPLMCEIIIADNTGLLRVSLWNSLVVKHWRRLKVGNIVAARGLRLKYSLRADNSSIPTFDVEASLNPSNPTGTLFILHEDQLPGAVEYKAFMNSRLEEESKSVSDIVFESPAPSCMPLGELSYPFVPISIIHTTPEDVPVDVAGLIAFAGRVEREPGAGKNQFLVSRWILVVDPSSDERFLPIRIFTNSRSDVVLTLKAGDVALFTNIHVKSSVSSALLFDLIAKHQRLKESKTAQYLIGSQDLQTEHFNPFAIVLEAWSRRQASHDRREEGESNDSLDPRWRRVRYGWDAVLTKLTQTRAVIINKDKDSKESEKSRITSSEIDSSQTGDDVVEAIVSMLARPSVNEPAFGNKEAQDIIVRKILSEPMMRATYKSSRSSNEADTKDSHYTNVSSMRTFYGQSSHLTEVVTADAWHKSVNESLSKLADLNEICSWAREQFPHLKSLQIDSRSAVVENATHDVDPTKTSIVFPDDPTVLTCMVQCRRLPTATPVLGSKLILSSAVPCPTRCSVIMSAFAKRMSTLAGVTPVSMEILQQVYPNSAANPLTIAECVSKMNALALLQSSILLTKGAVPLALTPCDAGLLPWGDPNSGLLLPPLRTINEVTKEATGSISSDQVFNEDFSVPSNLVKNPFPESAFNLTYPLGYLALVDRNGENIIRVNLTSASVAHISPEVTAMSYAGSSLPSVSISLLSEVLQMINADRDELNEIALTPFSASILTKGDIEVIRQFGLPRYFVLWASTSSSSLMTQETLGRLLKLYATSLCLASTVASLYPRVSACLKRSKQPPSAKLRVLLMFLTYLRCKMLFTSVEDEWISAQRKQSIPPNELSESPAPALSDDNKVDSHVDSPFSGAAMWSRAVAGMMLAAGVSAFFHIRASQSIQRTSAVVEESSGSRYSPLWAALVQGRESAESVLPPMSSVIGIYRSSPGVLNKHESSFKAKLISLGSDGAKLEELAGNTGLYTMRGPGERTLYHPPDIITNLSHLVSMPEGVEVSLQGMFGSIDGQACEEINEALQWRIDVYKSLLSILREDSAELEQHERTLSYGIE